MVEKKRRRTGSTLDVHVDELLEVGANDLVERGRISEGAPSNAPRKTHLIRIHEDDTIELEREENV